MPTQTTRNFPQRVPLEALRPDLSILIPVTMANGSVAAQGDVLGLVTTTNFGRRRTRTIATGGFSTLSANGTVTDANLFRVGDVLQTSGGNAIGTVSAINAATNTITLAANSQSNVASGTAVIASDGSSVAKAIADEGSDGVLETPIRAFISGLLVESRLRGLDASAKSELFGASAAGGIFKF